MKIDELSRSVPATFGRPFSSRAGADQLLTSDLNPSVVTRTYKNDQQQPHTAILCSTLMHYKPHLAHRRRSCRRRAVWRSCFAPASGPGGRWPSRRCWRRRSRLWVLQRPTVLHRHLPPLSRQQQQQKSVKHQQIKSKIKSIFIIHQYTKHKNVPLTHGLKKVHLK